jgi:hypothetical protein
MRARFLSAALFAGLVLMVTVHPSAQASSDRKLELSFDQAGHVTLVANHVSIRDILTEWARLGGTTFVNADKLPNTTLDTPIQFDHAPEAQVMESLLRSAAGFVLGPRLEGGATGPSRLASVFILPTSHATAMYTAPANGSPVAAPISTMGSPDDEIPPVTPLPQAPPPPSTQPNQAPGNQPSLPGAPVGSTGPAVPISPVTPTTGTGRGRGGGGGGGGGY